MKMTFEMSLDEWCVCVILITAVISIAGCICLFRYFRHKEKILQIQTESDKDLMDKRADTAVQLRVLSEGLELPRIGSSNGEVTEGFSTVIERENLSKE